MSQRLRRGRQGLGIAVVSVHCEPIINRILQLAAWLALGAIIFVTASPIEMRPTDVIAVNYDRALAFTVLAALFVLAYPRRWAVVGLAVIVGASGIELLQELSPTRHARLSDALVKAAGAVLGVLIAASLNALLERRREQAGTRF